MMNLSLEGKIIVFKILALSKIVCLCLTSVVPKRIIEEIYRKYTEKFPL